MGLVYDLPHSRNGFDGIVDIVDRLTKPSHHLTGWRNYNWSNWPSCFFL